MMSQLIGNVWTIFTILVCYYGLSKADEQRGCEGLEDNEILYAHHFDNDRFKNCTTITDNIIIGATSFDGDPWEGSAPVTVEMLEVFSTVKVITGFLSVQSSHYSFRSLSMFRNLEEIHGHQLYGDRDAFSILASSLRSLGLVSLRMIRGGDVRVTENPNLCFVTDEVWRTVLPNGREPEISNNRAPDDCIADGDVCDEQCKDIGCWGPGPDQCVECKNAQLGSTCMADCNVFGGQFVLTEAIGNKPKICERCDPECNGRCNGPGPSNCTKCLHVQDGPYCRPECPDMKYASPKDNTCQPCHENCIEGCTGPFYHLGPKGCNNCHYLLRIMEEGCAVCMPPNVIECKDHEWYDRISSSSNDPLKGYEVCKQCHPQCTSCDGEGPSKCTECRNYEVIVGPDVSFCANNCPVDYPYIQGVNKCVSNCSANQFIGVDNMCKQCHIQCIGGCYGESRTACVACLHFEFEGSCRSKCPSNTKADGNNVCVRDRNAARTKTTNRTHIRIKNKAYSPSADKH